VLLVIDNYDSFTYNLVQYLGELGQDLMVHRNDSITLAEIEKLAPSYIVISPGPGRPENAGITQDVIRKFGESTPILGVCLGHQAIGQVFGGVVTYAQKIMHGKTSEITHDGDSLFKGLPNPFVATRYHSLVLESRSLPESLKLSAWTADGEVMAIRHDRYPIEGIQFHPESILTPNGKDILKNFLDRYRKG